MTQKFDPKSIAGKFPVPELNTDLLVVGAGPSGVAEAIKAAKAGRTVTLVDENPVAGALMGMDVPLFYGQRMTAAVQNKERMVEQVLTSNAALEEAFELGVDVQLGVYVWGAFVNGPGVQSLPGNVAGLADEERSWMLGFSEIVVATGARDLVLSFPGIEQPGCMGAVALDALLSRYDEFSGRRIVILGSGTLALETALQVLDNGREVAALVEVRDEAQGPAELVAAVRTRGVEILTNHIIVEAVTNALAGVEAAELIAVDQAGKPVPGTERRIDCDTICLAVGSVPNVELLDVLGCKLTPRGDLGGHVPVLDEDGRTSVAAVRVVGASGGVAQDNDAFAYRLDWMRALLEVGGLGVHTCLCEEVTRAELLGVQPPRYLGCSSNKVAALSLDKMLEDGPANHDQMKRLTRVSMGACQARRCREQVALLLALASGKSVAEIPLAGYRAPMRPLPLSVLSDDQETQAMRDDWDVWFGIATQWVPYDDIGTEREARYGDNMHL
jgi:thioredoxin reductase